MDLEELGALLPKFQGDAAAGAPLISLGYFEQGGPTGGSSRVGVNPGSFSTGIVAGGQIAGKKRLADSTLDPRFQPRQMRGCKPCAASPVGGPSHSLLFLTIQSHLCLQTKR